MISAVRVGKKVQVNVSDQGPGIPLELQQKVFEPFFQEAGRPSREKTARGMGLGLAICKGLVEAHGGRIWIDDGTANQRRR